MMKRTLAFLLCLCMALTCVSALAEDTTYTALYASEVSTLNYLIASKQWEQTVGANIVDTLVEYDNTGKIIPGLAESWENSDDGLVWTFHLRQGQKWYDYTGAEVAEVTANDFVSALKYILTPEYESAIEYAVEGAYILNADKYYAGEITDFAEVGVKALDDYTVEYTLSAPLPYFLSSLTYGSFLPAYGPLLEELGADFGTSNDKLYYSGAYIMTEYVPQGRHYYVKNANNWDADNIFIEAIERIYNSSASTSAPAMALRGDVDSASLDVSIVDDWKANHGDIVTRSRVTPDYSYFYAFNFNPQYDEAWNPGDWLIAVNNANFRHSIMSAFDRTYAMRAMEPEDPESITQRTITPATFSYVDGTDFSTLPAFDGIEENFFNADAALAYKAAAIEELTEAGVTFPIQMLVSYRSDMADWENESILLKQQIEGVLGTDYVVCVLNPRPTENFLPSTRTGGQYSFMRCNWGADYADPQTFTDPFAIKRDSETGEHIGNTYNKMDLMLESDFAETKEFLTAYYAAVDAAKAEVVDMTVRYNKFAEAEAMLINNAMVIPYYISPADYQVTKLNIFEGEYAPFGISILRFKYQHLSDEFITAKEYEANFAEWQAQAAN
ncbi:MAG: peptide ABC transporter substrate-binding protein [Christensenellaceae bacterium]|nr:peptide ABC transporter substrate-binding protein [Christensenellaceae bacterium]